MHHAESAYVSDDVYAIGDRDNEFMVYANFGFSIPDDATINGIEVNSSPKLQEIVAQFRPNDKIHVVYTRDGKEREADVILKNKNKGVDYLTKSKVEVVDVYNPGAKILLLGGNECIMTSGNVS